MNFYIYALLYFVVFNMDSVFLGCPYFLSSVHFSPLDLLPSLASRLFLLGDLAPKTVVMTETWWIPVPHWDKQILWPTNLDLGLRGMVLCMWCNYSK